MNYSDVVKIYFDHFELLNKLLSSSEFKFLLKNNDSLFDVFLNQISIIQFLEKKLSNYEFIKNEIENKKDKTEIIEIEKLNKKSFLIESLKKISDKNIKTQDLNFKNLSEIKDLINYLDVFLKNNYKKTSNDFALNKTSTPDNQTNFVEKESNSENKNYFNEFKQQNDFNFNEINKESILNFQYQELAKLRLNSEISKGIVYKFKTKPKSILIIKLIIGTLFTLLALVSLFLGILPVAFFRELKFSTPKANVANVNTHNGVSFNIIEILLSVTIFSVFSFLMFKQEKNENKKFDFPKFITISIVVILILQLWTFIQSIKDGTNNYQNISDDFYKGKNSYNNKIENINAYYAYFVLLIIRIVIYVLVFIFSLIALVYSPKSDNERLEKILEKYTNEIKAQANK